MMKDSQVCGAVALSPEKLPWAYSAIEVVRSVLALVCKVDHDSLERVGLAGTSRHILVGMQRSVACEMISAIAAN